MAKRQTKAASATAWRQTPAGEAKYRDARARAQAAANADGMDRGIEWRDGTVPYMQDVVSFILPRKHNRFGHQTLCEVVSCENLAKTQPGHGPHATRPPSLKGQTFTACRSTQRPTANAHWNGTLRILSSTAISATGQPTPTVHLNHEQAQHPDRHPAILRRADR